ncbi:hypothetical protein GCM10020001_087500 [Nonomuraea salmonea]
MTLAPPAHRASGKCVEQHPPQVRALDFGPAALPVVGLLEQHGSVRAQCPHRLAALQHDGAEGVTEPGGFDRELAVVVVDVEHAALCPRIGRGFGFVDLDRYAVYVQDAGQGEAAEPGADDRDSFS